MFYQLNEVDDEKGAESTITVVKHSEITPDTPAVEINPVSALEVHFELIDNIFKGER